MRKIFLFALAQGFAILVFAQTNNGLVIDKIKDEEQKNSQVMDIAFHLTDVSGPRLTSSPGFMRAAEWAKNTLASWGLKNAALEPWGDFGKGWQQEKCYVAMTKPYYAPLIAYARAWTGSTGKKMLTGDILLINATDSATLVQQYTGKLKGRIVMMMMPDTLHPSFTPDGERFADSSLDKMAKAQPQNRQGGNQQFRGNPNFASRQAFQRTLTSFYNSEKPALVLTMSARGSDGTVFVQSGGSYMKDQPEAPASVVLSSDDYLRLQRLVKAGVPLELEADVKTKFFTNDTKGYNVVAEIPGTDPKLKDELVMLGGHLDSWHAGTGATDNAAGCSVMMEVVRLMTTMGLQPKRTIRIVLWSGEEEGLFGSRNYVKNHFGDPATMKLTPDQAKVSAYYNLDNGTGKIRGVYLQGNDKARELFQSWLTPFNDMGASTITINNTGGTDHLSFDAVGIPGFQFIQDPIEYDTRTHHSNMDTYDHLVPEDLKQAVTVVAAFVYNTAQREEMIPRKPLPEPRGNQRGF
ncbi:MAG: M28 family metallopeptidase [Flavisolibacter sp.]